MLILLTIIQVIISKNPKKSQTCSSSAPTQIPTNIKKVNELKKESQPSQISIRKTRNPKMTEKKVLTFCL